jgi:hypothetical protein
VVELDPIEFEQTPKERMDSKSQATEEKRNKTYPLIPVMNEVAVGVYLPIHGY